MELKIKEFSVPASIDFNFEELKQELAERVRLYKTTVYTDEQIKLAKSDRASLNKLKKALNDERLRREREYMAPFNEFKAKINEIISIIDEPVSLIDSQVKAYEEKCKADKMEEIKKLWEMMDSPDWLPLEMIFSDKWLNSSVSLRSIQEEMSSRLTEIAQATETLANLPEFGFEALEAYKSSLDLNMALNEGRRLADIQKRKEEQERLRREAEEAVKAVAVEEGKGAFPDPAEPEVVEAVSDPEEQAFETEECERVWLAFRVNVSIPEALELRAFLEERGIQFEAVK